MRTQTSRDTIATAAKLGETEPGALSRAAETEGPADSYSPQPVPTTNLILDLRARVERLERENAYLRGLFGWPELPRAGKPADLPRAAPATPAPERE